MQLRTLLSATILILALPGCDMVSQVKEGINQSTAAAEAIEKQIGAKPEVGFNYNNGSLTTVTVQFHQAPTTPLPEIERVARSAVVEAFKNEPGSLVIAFVYEKKAQ